MAKRLSPAVSTVVVWIREGIEGGRLEQGLAIPAEQDLSEQLGVSRGTVRQAIDVLVSTGELSRKPHARPIVGLPTVRGTKNENFDVHVWVCQPIADPSSLMFIKGISRGLAGSPYQMIVREPTRFFGSHVMSDERQFLMDLLESDCAAAVIQRDPFARNEDVIRQLLQAGKLLVFVDSPAPAGLVADHVGTANVAASRRCVEHLIELGHHDILCVADTDVPQPVKDRIRGYERAMQHAGLAEFKRTLLACALAKTESPSPERGHGSRLKNNNLIAEFAQRAVSAILAMPTPPSAVFVCYDVLAQQVQAGLERAGFSVPEDIAIVGFDDLGRWDAAQAGLTSASQDFEGFGHHAADLLLDRLATTTNFGPLSILLDAPLVIRASSSPKAHFLRPFTGQENPNP